MKKKALTFLLTFTLTLMASAAEQFVTFTKGSESQWLLTQSGDTVWYDTQDWEGVKIAVRNLRADLKNVTGSECAPIVVGTVGKSRQQPLLIFWGKIIPSAGSGTSFGWLRNQNPGCESGILFCYYFVVLLFVSDGVDWVHIGGFACWYIAEEDSYYYAYSEGEEYGPGWYGAWHPEEWHNIF